MHHLGKKKKNQNPNILKAVLVGDPAAGHEAFARFCLLGVVSSPKNQRTIYNTRIEVNLSMKMRPPPSFNHQGNGRRQRPSADIPAILRDGIAAEKGDVMDVMLLLWLLPPLDESTLGDLTQRIFEGAHVVGLCYNTKRIETLQKAVHKWYPKVIHYAPNVPIVLLGINESSLPIGNEPLSSLLDQSLDQPSSGSMTSPVVFDRVSRGLVNSTTRMAQIRTEIVEEAVRRIGAVGNLECSLSEEDVEAQCREVKEALAWVGWAYSTLKRSNGRCVIA